MSVLHTNNITNYSGTGGPTIEGISTVDSTGFMKVPVGDTRTRLVKDVENIVTDGLVLHLDAGRAESFGGDGTTWRDLSGNGNNGTLVNGVGFTVDDGGSLIFDAIDDYIDTSFSIPSMSSEFSFEIVVNISSGQVSGVGNQWGVLWNTNPGGSVFLGPGVAIFKPDNANGPWDIYVNESGVFSSNIIANTWNNITYVRDSSNNVKIYTNGVLSSGTYVDTTNHSTVIRFMRSNGTELSYIYTTLGKLATAKIYNRALTASEVLQNYEATKGRYL